MELQRQRDELKSSAIQELLAQRKEIDEQLTALGYQVEEATMPARRQKRELDPNKACSVCGFATEPPHESARIVVRQRKPRLATKSYRAKG